MLGSAAIAVLIDARLAAEGLPAFEGTGSTGGKLPAAFTDGFSQAMATSMLLPAAVLVLGLVASLLFERPRHEGYAGAPALRLVQPLRPTPDPHHQRQQAEQQQRSPHERAAERERRGGRSRGRTAPLWRGGSAFGASASLVDVGAVVGGAVGSADGRVRQVRAVGRLDDRRRGR